MSSWPPTPPPPTSVDEVMQALRAAAPGPPSFGEDDPWDFLDRWPNDALVFSWPAVSALLEDADPVVREQAVRRLERFADQRSLERVLDVVTRRPELFRDAPRSLSSSLSNFSVSFRGAGARIADALVHVLQERPPCGGEGVLARLLPHELIARAPRWGEGLLDQTSARSAATAMALYRRDHLLALLAALRGRSEGHRLEIVSAVEGCMKLTADQLTAIARQEELPAPTATVTLDDCRRALGVQ